MKIEDSIQAKLPSYANVLLQKGLNLQQDQILVINAPVESSDFVTILTRKLTKMVQNKSSLTGVLMI